MNTMPSDLSLHGMRTLDSQSKKAVVVLLRWVLIVSTGYLILFTGGSGESGWIAKCIVLLLMLSNFAVSALPERFFSSKHFDGVLVLTDITLISLSIWFSGPISSDFYLLYFLIIMIAAVSDTLRSVILSACFVTLFYLGMIAKIDGVEQLATAPVLIRIPFFFVVAIFYAYFAQLVRSEKAEKQKLSHKLGAATELRELCQSLSASLNRENILNILAHCERQFCKALYCAVISRSSKQIVAGNGDIGISDRAGEIFDTCARLAKRPEERDTKGPVEWAQVNDAYYLPVNGHNNSDLYICLVGEPDAEHLEHGRTLAVSASLALQNAGQYQQLIHEVDKRKDLVTQLGQALDFKTQFLTNISHEIRTPLTSFIGFGELLQTGTYGGLLPEQNDVIQRMLTNAWTLLELINNIIVLSTLEAGRLNIHCEEGKLDAFIREITASCTPLVKDKSVAIRNSTSERLPHLITDWAILKQITLNLVSNAVKFTPSGTVEIEVADASDKGFLRLTVRDTGIGIDPQQVEEIFKPFRQIEAGYEKEFAGTGLGLAITKKQVELLGGTIEVYSETNKGAEFIVTLPIRCLEVDDRGVKLLSTISHLTH